MLAGVAGSMFWMNNWEVQSVCTLDSHRTAFKTSELVPRKTFFSFKIPIHNFQEKKWFVPLNSICCKHSDRCHNYRCGTTTKTQDYASVPDSHRTHPQKTFLFFQNADSQFLMNTVVCSILTLFTSCKNRHQYNIGIIQIFELRIFSKDLWPQDVHSAHETCNIIPRAPHGFTHD